MRRPVLLWVGFAVLHIWLVLLALHGPGQPIGDVQNQYPGWVRDGLRTGHWVGIQTPWVYPVLALVPIAMPWLVGPSHYVVGFLVLACLADLAALAVLLGRRPTERRLAIGAGWALFLLLLGPIAIGRIDAFATALALCGLVVLARHPRVSAALLTAAAWIKVWPAALVAALIVARQSRRAILVVAASVSVGIVVVDVLLGGNPLSFLDKQSGRGLQIESVFATPLLIGARSGEWSVYFDVPLSTYQLRGPGVDAVAAIATPVLVVLVVALLGLAIIAVRRGADSPAVTSWISLALVATLVAANKVGSPQFVGWFAAPVAAGLLSQGFGIRRGFGIPGILVLAIAVLTQIIYPGFYHALVALEPWMLAVISVRNVLEIALCAVAIVALVRLAAAHPMHREAAVRVRG